MSTVDKTEGLVLDHLQIVEQEVRLLLRRMPPHVERDELVSTGFVALVACARRFASKEGVPFARVARPRVRGALLDHLRRLDWASRGVRRRAREVESAKEALGSSLGRTPTTVELADTLGMTADDVAASDGAAQRAIVLSLQAVLATTADPGVAGHVQSPEESTLRRELLGYLHDAVAALPERLRTVIVDCYFEERPVAETAADLGVSESRVSQMRTEALVLLRDGINTHLAPERVAAGRRKGCAARRRQDYFAAIAARGDLRSRLLPAHTAA
jgi:RNA polymerase sigma factor for flagellar operon FliA